MAQVMTYSSLVNQLTEWLNRTNDDRFIGQIPTIISQTETMIAREYKGLGTKKIVQANFQAGVAVYDKPVRWRETTSMQFGYGSSVVLPGQRRQQIFARSYDYCRAYWPNADLTDADFPPKYYCEYDWGHWLIVPTPIVAFPWEVVFYERPQPLDEENQQNWLTLYAPDLLFKGCVLWASRNLRSDKRVAALQQDYDRALQTQMGEDVRRIIDAAQDEKEGV